MSNKKRNWRFFKEYIQLNTKQDKQRRVNQVASDIKCCSVDSAWMEQTRLSHSLTIVRHFDNSTNPWKSTKCPQRSTV